ncbi:MAG: HD domain-containing protein [Myxococcota bacterium]|nr:HD domain-containing protein [Myxococcota bacterium]
MNEKANPASLFSQKLDRVAFVAYLLGAIVPLIGLAVVVERFVLPEIRDRLAIFGLIGVVISIAVLSLASFFTLRRTTKSSLSEMDRNNRRLAALLEVAGALTNVNHASDVGEQSAKAALTLVGARAAFVLARSEPGTAPERLASAGPNAEKLELELVEPLVEMAKLVMSQGRPAVRGAEEKAPAMAAVPLLGEAVPEGALIAVAGPKESEIEAAEVDALTSLGTLSAVALRSADLKEAQRNFFTHVTDMLVSALDSTLGYHKGHGTRVAQYANRLAREMGLDEHRLQRLHFAALMHDIGMLKLERQQQQSARASTRHTVLGGRMLGRIRLWQDLAPVVQSHHEWWDGSGYPEGLSGDAIPLESQIIAVCDAFDAMTSASSYKDPMPIEEALREIESGAGTQFAPDAASAMAALIRRGEIELIPSE